MIRRSARITLPVDPLPALVTSARIPGSPRDAGLARRTLSLDKAEVHETGPSSRTTSPFVMLILSLPLSLTERNFDLLAGRQ